jgi:uncharacterized membrane protein
MPIVRRAFLIAAPVWVAAMPLATYAATREHAPAIANAFALAIYGIGSLVCHQKPERSFHLWGAQLPVCARCAGIYLGAAAALIRRRAKASRVVNDREILALAALPTVATLLFEWTTGMTPSNTIRFVSGLPIGAVVSWLVTSRVD